MTTHERLQAIHARVGQITAEIERMPSCQRLNAHADDLVRERSRLLLERDELAAPARPTPAPMTVAPAEVPEEADPDVIVLAPRRYAPRPVNRLTRDEQARIIAENAKYGQWWIQRTRGRVRDWSSDYYWDLDGEVQLAMVEAARAYDPTRGGRFGTYARGFIVNRINGVFGDFHRRIQALRIARGTATPRDPTGINGREALVDLADPKDPIVTEREKLAGLMDMVFESPPAKGALDELVERGELDRTDLVAVQMKLDGKTLAEIAWKAKRTARTVQRRIAHVFRKLVEVLMLHGPEGTVDQLRSLGIELPAVTQEVAAGPAGNAHAARRSWEQPMEEEPISVVAMRP